MKSKTACFSPFTYMDILVYCISTDYTVLYQGEWLLQASHTIPRLPPPPRVNNYHLLLNLIHSVITGLRFPCNN